MEDFAPLLLTALDNKPGFCRIARLGSLARPQAPL